MAQLVWRELHCLIPLVYMLMMVTDKTTADVVLQSALI